MVLLEAEGRVQGEGRREAAWEGRALWLLSGERTPPKPGTGQCKHKAGSPGKGPQVDRPP